MVQLKYFLNLSLYEYKGTSDTLPPPVVAKMYSAQKINFLPQTGKIRFSYRCGINIFYTTVLWSEFCSISQNWPNNCSKIHCTHLVSATFANVPLLQKCPILGTVSLLCRTFNSECCKSILRQIPGGTHYICSTAGVPTSRV